MTREAKLRKAIRALAARWEASIGYGQGGTEQHRSAVERCRNELLVLVEPAGRRDTEGGR